MGLPCGELAAAADALLAFGGRFSRAAIHLAGRGIVVDRGTPSGDVAAVAAAVAAAGREVALPDAEGEGRSPECYAGSYSLLGLPLPGGALVLESEQIGAFAAAELAAARAAAAEMARLLGGGLP